MQNDSKIIKIEGTPEFKRSLRSLAKRDRDIMIFSPLLIRYKRVMWLAIRYQALVTLSLRFGFKIAIIKKEKVEVIVLFTI